MSTTKDEENRTRRARQPGRAEGKTDMKNWKTEKALYEIHEICRKSHEVYHLVMTGEEISAWCKMKREAHGYIPGCGGDKMYECWAVVCEY